MMSEARLTKAARAAGIAEKINNSAYGYYGATITETSGDAGAAKGLKRLFAAALLSSTSVMAFGISGAAATPAACVQDGSTSTYTCSGDQGDTGILLLGDGVTVTADDTFVIEKAGQAFSIGAQRGIAVSGDGSTFNNYGSVSTSVTPSHYTYGRHDAISVTGMTGTSRVENKEGGYASTTGDESFGLYAFSGEVAQAVNAGTVVTTGDNSNALVSRGGTSALAENSGSITTEGDSAAGMYAFGSTAIATNTGTIYVEGQSSAGIALAGDTVTGTNNGTIEVSGDYSVAMTGNSYGLATTNIVNNNTITVTSEYSAAILGVGPTVNITNAEDAAISSGASGIAVVVGGATSGTITNAGIITGDVNGGGDRLPIGRKARAASGMTVENTGTIVGTVDFAYATGTTVNNNGGGVGDGSNAIIVGYGENTVTISGEGNDINGTISARSVVSPPMGFAALDVEPEPDSTINFRQTDTLRLTGGLFGEEVFLLSREPRSAIVNFQTVNFFDGVTEFSSSTITRVGDGDRADVNIYGGATVRANGNVVFNVETLRIGAVEEAEFERQAIVPEVATLSVAADSFIQVSGDVTFAAGGRFTVGIDEPSPEENVVENVVERVATFTNGFLYGGRITFEEGSQIYADVTRGIELTDGARLEIAGATSDGGIRDYGVSVYDNTTLFDFSHEVDTDTDSLYLIVERVLTAAQATINGGGRPNAKEVAAALDRFIENAPVDNPIVVYLSQFPIEDQEEQLYKLVQDSLPSETNSDGSSTVTSTDMVLDLVMDRLAGGASGVADAGGDSGVSAGDQALGGDYDLALWGRVGGSTAEYTPDGLNGFDSDTFAASLGIDGEFAPHLRIGVAAFYSNTGVDENGAGANSNQDIEGYGALVYGSYRPGDYYVNATFGYGFNNYDSTRVALGGANIADYDGTQIMARAEAGKILDYGNWEVTPHAGIRFNQVSIDGYTETGPLPTTVSGQDLTSVRGVLGVGARYTHEMENGAKLIPEFHLRGIEELADPNEAITGSVVGGGTFVSQSEGRDRFSLGAGAGLTYEMDDKVTLRLLYDGEFQSDYQEHGLTAAIRIAF